MGFPAQKKRFFLLAGIFCLFLLPFLLEAKTLFCHICHARIRGQYFLVNKMACCSRDCAGEMRRQLLPECHLCRKTMERFVRIFSHRGEGNFCVSCNTLPKCFHCRFPGQAMSRLADGRRLCKECRYGAVIQPGQAEELFRATRQNLWTLLGIRTNHRIAFSLTDTRKMALLHPGSGQREWGLFLCRKLTRTREERSNRTGKLIRKYQLPTEKTYSIYILSHLSPASFAQTAVHELTHDFMEEYYPHIKESLWCEGAAEYIAYLYNAATKNSGRNAAMKKNPDPVYGGGLLMFCKKIPESLPLPEKIRHFRRILDRKNRGLEP